MDKNSAIKFFLNTFAGGDDENLRNALAKVSIVKNLRANSNLLTIYNHKYILIS